MRDAIDQQEIDRLWNVKVRMVNLLNMHSEEAIPDLINLLGAEMRAFDAQAVDMLFVEFDLTFLPNEELKYFLKSNMDVLEQWRNADISFRARIRLETVYEYLKEES